MPTMPSISDAEWRVMQVLWDKRSATAGEVVDALADAHDWHPRTIKTMLGRLLRKGALGHRVEGKRYVYFPRLKRDAVRASESRSFVDRVFDGDALSAMAHLARTGKLSGADLQKLRELFESDG